VPRATPVPGAPPLRTGVPTAGVATARGQAGPIAGVATERGQGGPVAGAPIRGRAPGNAPIGDELAHNLGAAASKVAIDDDPLLDPAALSAAQMLRDRFHGALIGLAVGDAVAAATQFRRPGTFTPVGDMLGGGPFDLPRGAWSDDTSMALCLADSLLECNGFDARDQMERYRRWQQEGYLAATGQCVGITASTARAIAIAQWRRQAFFGSHDPSQVDPEPLSRVAPAVLFFFASSGPAVDQATEAARTTCQSPVVLEACRSLARALYAALSGQPKAVVLEKASMAAMGAAGDAVAGGGLPGGGVAGHQSAGASAGTGGGAPAVLAAAVAAFGATSNFRDAILYAANLGGDSDVIAAVCGQLAGAYYSVKAIPTSWHNGLMHKELIADCADRLLAHAMLGLSG
jgi:ADP-ribosyl-[dinitrogen reductase] hydrolase